MPSNLVLTYKAFATRNGFPVPYTQFPAHMDVILQEIETWAQQATTELNALTGRTAALGRDAVLTEAFATGRLGQHSADLTAEDNTSITVTSGRVFAGSDQGIVNFTGSQVFASGFPSSTLFLSVDATGALNWSDTASSGALDLYSRAWNGSQFTAPAVALAAILPDGDEQVAARTASSSRFTTDFPTGTFEQFGDRITPIEDFLARPRSFSQGTNAAIASGLGTTALAFGTDDYLEGITHSTVTNTDQFTIVTAGLYMIIGGVVFDESTSSSPNTGTRIVQSTINGSSNRGQRVAAAASGDTEVLCIRPAELTVGQIVRLVAAQDSTGTMDTSQFLALVRIAPTV